MAGQAAHPTRAAQIARGVPLAAAYSQVYSDTSYKPIQETLQLSLPACGVPVHGFVATYTQFPLESLEKFGQTLHELASFACAHDLVSVGLTLYRRMRAPFGSPPRNFVRKCCCASAGSHPSLCDLCVCVKYAILRAGALGDIWEFGCVEQAIRCEMSSETKVWV